MKNFISFALMLLVVASFAQNKGTIKGILLDKEMSNEPLPFANVFVKNTQIGTTTEFEGDYQFQIDPGTYTLVFSFVGYQKVEVPNIIVKADEITTVPNVIIGAAEGVSLKEVIVKATTGKETEKSLLIQQKKATLIKESIGAVRLAKIGISNAASATSKISGVTKNEGTGDVYVRGLGDRYLSTTMNGLPIPSDDVEKKNIDLNLFSTDIIQNVGISKTYTTSNYADQSSGTIDITSKEFTKNRFSLSIRSGLNTTVIQDDSWSSFKTTQNSKDINFGFYSTKRNLADAITRQSWNTENKSSPLNFKLTLSGEQKFELFNKNASVFFVASHLNAFVYQKGIFKKYRSNVLDNNFNDTDTYQSTINTTALFNFSLKLNPEHKFSFNSLFVNKTIDNLYEQGRNGEGYVFDQDPQEFGAFVRDQNLKETQLLVNQLLGYHNLNKTNKLSWALGYNIVKADEPNRIRNEVNIINNTTVQFAHVGDFQQRKSSQKITDTEINGFIKDQLILLENEDGDRFYRLNIGANFRNKERDFNTLFVGVRAKGFQVSSIDNLSAAFTQNNFDNGNITLKTRQADTYNAVLNVLAGYVNIDFGFGKFSGNTGLRYETNNIDVNWDVGNYPGREGSVQNNYNTILPNVNLKYELTEINFIRLSASKTITLPEFKELSPFEYVSPVGRVTGGNPKLKKSINYNLDLKWELFPSSGGLFSFSSFYKRIIDPINLAQARGSSGNFTFDNTGDKADVIGLEFETRINLIKPNEDENNSTLDLNFNATKMWFNQDLHKEFQYKNKTSSKLQGASDFIVNTSLSYSNTKENEFTATLSANYSSDKIFALGAPEDFTNSATLYNDEIIENGFVSLDLILNKKITNNLSLKLTGKNLLNPNIKQTQKVRNLSTQIETNETVVSYKKGILLNLSLKYSF